jgi:hypothetical protein
MRYLKVTLCISESQVMLRLIKTAVATCALLGLTLLPIQSQTADAALSRGTTYAIGNGNAMFGIAFDADGRLYVGSSASGGVVYRVGAGQQPQPFLSIGYMAMAMAFDPTGNLWVQGSNVLKEFSSEGALLHSFNFAQAGLAITSTGIIYVGDSAGRINAIDTSGALTTLAAIPPGFGIWAMSVDRMNNLYVLTNTVPASIYGSGSVLKYSTSGVLVSTFGGFTQSQGMTVDLQGNIFVAQSFVNPGVYEIVGGTTASTKISDINVNNEMMATSPDGSVWMTGYYGTVQEVRGPTISMDSATQWSSNGHYYAYVDCGCQWATAYEEARRTFFRGSQGYLVTITSSEEQSFIGALGHAEYYIGAADHPDYILNPATGQPVFQYLYPYNDVAKRHQVNTDPAASYGHYYWVSGPEAGTKIGIANPRGAGQASTFTSEPGAFSNFLNGASPDDAFSGQDFVYQYGGAYWDDTTALNESPHGYIVEFDAPTAAPAAPTVNAPSSPASGQLTWTWSPNATGRSAITSYSWSGACSGSGNVTTVTCSGLTGGTNYTLYVTATNGVGTSGSGSRSGTALSYSGAPTANASPATGLLNVSWTAPVSNGGTPITGYTATATAAGRSYSCTSTTSKCSITGLTNGTTYQVSVVATNAKGNSVPSNTVSIYPAPDTKFLAYSPNSVVLVKSNFQVLVANAKAGALVTVTAAGATKTCTANAVGECSVTLNSAKSAGWVIVASYVDGKKTVSTATSYRVNIANITVSSVQVAKGKSFTVKISSGAPNTKFQVATSDGVSYSVNLTSAGAGTITVVTKAKGTLTLAISDNGTLLQTTTVAVV